jgi:hypothetical protein
MSIDPARATRLKRVFDGACKDTKLNARSHRLFLEAICTQPDPAACLNTLATSQNGVQSIKDAIWSDVSPVFCNGLAADVIDYLSSPDLTSIAGGELLRRVFQAMVDPPIFWSAFIDAFKTGQLQEKAQRAFAILLLRLLQLLPADVVVPYRELAHESSIIKPLLDSSLEPIRDIGAQIKALTEAYVAGTSVPKMQDGPGGRHDNDNADFRQIAIVPTAEEIQSTKAPFLRTSDELDDPQTEATRSLDYLDNQFRLLREDMLYEVREDMAAMAKKKRKSARLSDIDSLVLHNVHYVPPTNPEDTRAPKWHPWALCLRRTVDFPQLDKVGSDESARKRWLTDRKNRDFIKHQSLVILMADDKLLALGTLHRDEDLLASNPPVVVVQLQGEATVVKSLLTLKSARDVRLVCAYMPLFAYEPVLKTLQDTVIVPLERELLLWKPSDPPSTITGGTDKVVAALQLNPSRDLKTLLDIPKSIILDKSQAASFLLGLTQTISLIQGPPG